MGNPSTLTTEGVQRWPSAIEPTLFLDHRAFGGPVELASISLREEAEGFVTDVSNALHHFAENDWQSFRGQSREFVSEMRRAFLRSHRRLSVHVRSEGVEAFDRVVAVETVELARRYRDLVLGRSSRVVHEAWPVFSLHEALVRVSGYLPETVGAPLEPRSFAGRDGDGLVVSLRRLGLRWRRRWRRLFRRPELTRQVPLRALGRHRLLEALPAGLEGMASILVQAELQLALRSRQLFADIESALVTVGESESVEQAQEFLEKLKLEAEEEFLLAESEQQQHGLDALKRIQSTLGNAVQAWKRDLEIAGTFELPAPHDPAPDIEGLEQRMKAVQKELSGAYAVSAMRIEFAAFHQDLEEGLEDFIESLEKDIRGRSFTQLDRVGQALDAVIDALQKNEGDEELLHGVLPSALEPMERVVQEAFRESNRLEEQLLAEGATQPLVDTLTRVASGLTDRYRVPQTAMERSEWRLPAAPGTVEIPFANLVSTYVQVDLAPHLIERTSRASKDLEPMQATLSDVGRLVRYNPDQYGSELELEGTGSLGPLGIREALLTAAKTHRDALENLKEASASWSRDMGRDLRQVVNERLDAFAERLREGEVHRIRAARRRRGQGASESGLDISWLSLQPLRDLWRRSGLERRFQRLRRRAQVEGRRRSRKELEALLSPPRFAQIPVYYRRLFAPQSHWAGDIVPSRPEEMRRATEVLKKSVAGLRTAAVIGVDGAGRGAVVSAILQQAGLASIRRLNLLKPTREKELQENLADLSRDQLVVITGLGYLMASEPGGFDPLQRLTELIVEDAGKNAWLLEVDDLVWRFGAQATPIRDVFLERVGVRALGRGEIERAIFARHHLSGMKLEFRQTGRTELVPSDGSGEGPVQQEFFRELHRASGGLLQVALTLWLAAIEGFAEEAKKVQVRDVPPTPKAALDELPEEDVELLYLVLRQGWICASTLGFVLQLDGLQAEGRLRRLVHRGLLERSVDEVYVVRRHLRGVAHELLQDRGFV